MVNVKVKLPNGAWMQVKMNNPGTTMGHLLHRIRRYCHVEAHEGLFLLLDTNGIESIPMMTMRLSELKKDQVVKVMREETFGCVWEEGVVEESWAYEYSYLVPCMCSPRHMQLHGPIYDVAGTRYNLDKWVRIDIFSCGSSRRKKATTSCQVCKPKLAAWMLGQMTLTNFL